MKWTVTLSLRRRGAGNLASDAARGACPDPRVVGCCVPRRRRRCGGLSRPIRNDESAAPPVTARAVREPGAFGVATWRSARVGGAVEVSPGSFDSDYGRLRAEAAGSRGSVITVPRSGRRVPLEAAAGGPRMRVTCRGRTRLAHSSMQRIRRYGATGTSGAGKRRSYLADPLVADLERAEHPELLAQRPDARRYVAPAEGRRRRTCARTDPTAEVVAAGLPHSSSAAVPHYLERCTEEARRACRHVLRINP